MKTTKSLHTRYVLNAILAKKWTAIDPPYGASYRTWMHSSGQWSVVLCVKGVNEGEVRVTPADLRTGVPEAERAAPDWFTCEPKELWLRLWESGAPDIARPEVEVAS